MNTTSKQTNMTERQRIEQLERKVELLEKALHPLFGKPRKPKPSPSMTLIQTQLKTLINKHQPRK
jgi:hypothetical protein